MINKIIRGADLLCYVNGNLIGEFTDLSYSIDYGRKPIYGIDNPNPFEIIVGSTRVNGKISALRIRSSAGLEGRGIVARMSQIDREKYISISIIDRVSDLEVLKIEKAQVTNQTWSTQAKGLMTGSFSFEGLGADNEYSNIFGV